MMRLQTFHLTYISTRDIMDLMILGFAGLAGLFHTLHVYIIKTAILKTKAQEIKRK